MLPPSSAGDACDGRSFACSLIGERLFGKWRVCEDVGEARRREPLDVPDAEIPKDVVKAGRRLPTNDVAKARLELALKCCEFSGSMQHCLAVYSREFETLKSSSGVDLGAALSCPAPTGYRGTGRFSLVSIAATAGWCFRWCRAARDCGDHRSRPSHLWPH